MLCSKVYFPARVYAEIVDGNLKMTLGMIWTIILRFAIQDISVEGKCRIEETNFDTALFSTPVRKVYRVCVVNLAEGDRCIFFSRCVGWSCFQKCLVARCLGWLLIQPALTIKIRTCSETRIYFWVGCLTGF